MPIMTVEGLVKSYGRRRVVDGVSLQVDPGEVVGLLGPNGAGKTTTFRMICGMVRPDKGDVFLRDENVTRWPMYIRAKEGGMGYLPQQSSVFAKLTAEDNLLGIMQLLEFSRAEQKQRCEELLEQFKITHIRKTAAGRLSGGERRRLEIARCLVSNPDIIMLDEPFAGIDPVTVQNIQVVIRDLADKGIAILITDHAAREILQITDRTYVVSEGKILVSGTTDDIVRHKEVKAKYLGEIQLQGSAAATVTGPNIKFTKKSSSNDEPEPTPSTVRHSPFRKTDL
jgi:lipopolysaccharide export system ATP-binding protein